MIKVEQRKYLKYVLWKQDQQLWAEVVDFMILSKKKSILSLFLLFTPELSDLQTKIKIPWRDKAKVTLFATEGMEEAHVQDTI